MNVYSVLLITTIICYSSASNPKIKYPNCENITGEEIMEGSDFIPVDDDCIHCMCFKGQPKFCDTIECDEPPPLGCKKWTEDCCNYTCHDHDFNEMDGYHPSRGYDSPENSPYNKLKRYAGQLWDRVIHGKKPEVFKPSINDTFDYLESENTTADYTESTSIYDIPSEGESEDIPTQNAQEKLYKLHSLRNCRDINDIEVKEGQFYSPGPDLCTVCRCIYRRPRFCKQMDCETYPPKGCQYWSRNCCDYTCHDWKDSKENFFLNRWVDSWFKKTTPLPPDDLYV